MSRPAYIRRKPFNPEVQPYVVDRIEPHPHYDDLVVVIFKVYGNYIEGWKTEAKALGVAKGLFYLGEIYYEPDEWDELYVRVDEDRPAQEERQRPYNAKDRLIG